MRSHFGLRGLSVSANYGALVSELPAPPKYLIRR